MRTTFWSILSNTVKDVDVSHGILIPKIQRDYAQGRITTKVNEIRDTFVDSLRMAVLSVKSKKGEGVDLDFIYGTNEVGSFVPLDGQQRLTTLFLLHWYLAFKDKSIEEYRKQLSNFTYETRPSSNQFLKCIISKLTDEDHDVIFEQDKSFEQTIKDKNWYYSAWNYDNTIQSMLVMLDSIHSKFKESGITLEDLIGEGITPITFNFLQLDSFGLSDSVYIKMNARGKQLTSFENLKAQLSKFMKESTFNNNYSYSIQTSEGLKEVNVERYFATKVDTTWSDYFWKLRDDKNIFDNKLLNLLTFHSLNEMIVTDKENYDLAIKELEGVLNISYSTLNKYGLLTEQSLISYIDILDIICTPSSVVSEYLEVSKFLENTVKPIYDNTIKSDYERRVIYYGVFKFVLENKGELKFEELQKWSRLLHNLAINTTYDDSKDFLSSLKGINSFIEKYDGDMYSDFINHSITGFDTIQIKEELIKHHLKIKSDKWVGLFDQIEEHGYLKGQLVSLLVFSSIYQEYEQDQFSRIGDAKLNELYDNLIEKWRVFSLVFVASGLVSFEQEEFRRALLTIDNYGFKHTNWCFYKDNDRDLSWKRLLKETANKGQSYKVGSLCLIRLFDKLVSNEKIEKQLTTIIKSFLRENKEKDWKYYFIKYPILFKSTIQHYVKFFGDPKNEYIYCLNKTKYNREVDYDFMSLVLISELNKKEVNLDNIEFEYQSKYDQFGISKINGKSVKILYNTPLNRHVFTIKKYREDEYYVKSLNEVIDYIINN